MKPYASFIVVHFEVGRNTKNLEYQKLFWSVTIDLIALANRYRVYLTLQFNPQWVEYILKDQHKVALLKMWQEQGHEIGLHHHGYDHGDWNGYTNRLRKEDFPRFRGTANDMMKLMRRLVQPYRLLSGTITDEEFDYPQDIKYDIEGILITHARSKPKRVSLGRNNKIIQVGMALLSWEGDIESFKREYQKAKGNELFGVVTHEKDFAKNPAVLEEWMRFVRSRGETIESVTKIITNYQRDYKIEYSDKPLTFLKNVKGIA